MNTCEGVPKKHIQYFVFGFGRGDSWRITNRSRWCFEASERLHVDAVRRYIIARQWKATRKPRVTASRVSIVRPTSVELRIKPGAIQ
jgi:hypothetical protein